MGWWIALYIALGSVFVGCALRRRWKPGQDIEFSAVVGFLFVVAIWPIIVIAGLTMAILDSFDGLEEEE